MSGELVEAWRLFRHAHTIMDFTVPIALVTAA